MQSYTVRFNIAAPPRRVWRVLAGTTFSFTPA
jgi:hypothetical protein